MILLRPVQPEDADALFPLIYQTSVTDHLLWDGPQSLEEYRQALAVRADEVALGEKHMFTIVELYGNRAVGAASLRPDGNNFRADIGLWIGEAYHSRGYGTQTVRWLLGYGFNHLGLEKIDGHVFVDNWASRRIFEKCGFILEGTIRKVVCKRGEAKDEWLMGITRQDYQMQTEQDQESWLVHICRQSDWQEAQKLGRYVPDSLGREGFIHLSRPSQVIEVANRFYRGVSELLLLWIYPQALKAEVRWEAADGQVFPHLYGELNLEAILRAAPFAADKDGVFRRLF
jgi:uncharacterized protein (DUF952 family)/RimJ/RimL family protein N-acetyltransferase